MWIQRPSCFIDEHSACWSPLEAARALNWAFRSATENGRGRQPQSRCQNNHTSYNFIYLSHGPFCQRTLPARDSPRPSCVRVSHAGSEPVVTPDCPRTLRDPHRRRNSTTCRPTSTSFGPTSFSPQWQTMCCPSLPKSSPIRKLEEETFFFFLFSPLFLFASLSGGFFFCLFLCVFFPLFFFVFFFFFFFFFFFAFLPFSLCFLCHSPQLDCITRLLPRFVIFFPVFLFIMGEGKDI
jgi:hypothetical protein